MNYNKYSYRFFSCLFSILSMHALEKVYLLQDRVNTDNLSKIQELLPLLGDQDTFTIKLDHSLEQGASVNLETKIINISENLTSRVNNNNGLTATEKFEIATAYGKEKLKNIPFFRMTFPSALSAQEKGDRWAAFGASMIPSLIGLGYILGGAYSTSEETDKLGLIAAGRDIILFSISLPLIFGARVISAYGLMPNIHLSRENYLKKQAQLFAVDKFSKNDLEEIQEKFHEKTCSVFKDISLQIAIETRIKELEKTAIEL